MVAKGKEPVSKEKTGVVGDEFLRMTGSLCLRQEFCAAI